MGKFADAVDKWCEARERFVSSNGIDQQAKRDLEEAVKAVAVEGSSQEGWDEIDRTTSQVLEELLRVLKSERT